MSATKTTLQVLNEFGSGLAFWLHENQEYRPQQHDGTGFRWTEAEIKAVQKVRQGNNADGGSQG